MPPEFSAVLQREAGLSAERATAVANLIEEKVFARLASKDDIDILKARIADLDRQINDDGDIIFRDLAERIGRIPSETVKALQDPMRTASRNHYDQISRLKVNLWLVLGGVFIISILLGRIL